ncbi:MAG: hypothetical protein MUE91_07315 [Ignavibacteriaceae bacterium]|jgi:hypothetical protein|nr:hypothetical protein [Ignavibacteriaceae bacterium]
MKPVRAKDFYKKQSRIDTILNVIFGLTITAILFVAGYGFFEFRIWEYFK